MTAELLVKTLLDAKVTRCVERVIREASVHLPRRGTRWIATYRDGTGRQLWRSTGQTDRQAALIVAQALEKAARRARAEQGVLDRPVLRAPPGSGLTQKEVALLMRLSQRAVRDIEKRALRKLKQHPALRALWRELVGESATSTLDLELTDNEKAAVYALARTWAERQSVDEIIALMNAQTSRSPSGLGSPGC